MQGRLTKEAPGWFECQVAGVKARLHGSCRQVSWDPLPGDFFVLWFDPLQPDLEEQLVVTKHLMPDFAWWGLVFWRPGRPGKL